MMLFVIGLALRPTVLWKMRGPDRQSRWRTSARHGRVRVRPGNLARSPLADGGYGWVTPTCLSRDVRSARRSERVRAWYAWP